LHAAAVRLRVDFFDPEVRATASGAVIIEKPGTTSDYKKRLYGVAKRRIIRGTTGEIMRMTRGDPDDDYKHSSTAMC
jgi:hypothetical protein